MDFWLIFAIVFGILGALAALFASKAKFLPEPDPDAEKYQGRYTSSSYRDDMKAWREDTSTRNGVRVLGRVLLSLAFFLVFWASFTIVPTNAIGIEVAFSRPIDARTNGWQWKQPWSKVVEFDASRQYLRFQGKGNEEDPSSDKKEWPSVPVKMENEATANVTVVIAWQMKAGTAEEKERAIALYRNYKTFDRLVENYVAANARSAAQKTYDRINPLVAGKNPTFAAVSDTMAQEMRQLVSSEIEIISVQVTGADYDDKTDQSIKDLQAEFAKTQLAEQQKITNEKVSAANAALVAALNDLILKDNCIKGAIAGNHNPGTCLQPGWGGTSTPTGAAK